MRKLLVSLAAALLAAGCSDGPDPAVATAMTVGPAVISMDAVGATQLLRARVRDQRGEPMPKAEIQWSVAPAGVATITPLGGDSALATSVGGGTATYTAASGGVSATGTVEVAQTLAEIRKADGDGQTGAAGEPLPAPLRVRVLDRLGAPVPGVTVTFLVAWGGGSLSAVAAVSDANGIAATVWTVGPSVGLYQQVIATVGPDRRVEFEATVVAGPAAQALVWGRDSLTAARGTALPYLARISVRDAHGNSVAGVPVRFTVTSGGGRVTGAEKTTDAHGMAEPESWVLGTTVGVNTLTATFPGTPVPPVVLTAYAAIPGTVTVTAGEGQAALAGTAVPVAPTVLVRDSLGRPLAGLAVTFEVTAGGGSVGTATAMTNAAGVASAGSWVMGPGAATNRLSVRVRDVNDEVSPLRATGCAGGGAGYTMTLCFTNDGAESRRVVFQEAAARWSQIIRGDVPEARGSIPAEACDEGMPSADFVYDDLVIFASIRSIDGPGGILGAAGPCFVRAGSNLPFVGVMIFDAADVAALERDGQLSSVILHEMGHVLGIGTIWAPLGLLQNQSSPTQRLDTYFSGANALAGFNEIGGATYTGGQKVPVENGGGRGTFNSHWRESVLQNELMTGFLNPGVRNPLSVLTVRSLADLGYTVDPSAADAFSLASALRSGSAGTRLKLHNDIYRGPRYTMDRNGRPVRIR